jgi:hypothetical protein
MKKILVFIVFVFSFLFGFSQFSNLKIKESTHTQDMIFDSCYIVVKEFTLETKNNGSDLYCSVTTQIYKTKAISLDHPDWTLTLNEFKYFYFPFNKTFSSGNINDKVVSALKQYILDTHPSWSSNKIKLDNY